MDQSSHDKVNEGVVSNTPAAYAATTYQAVVMESGAPPTGAAFPPGSQGTSVYPVLPAQLSDQQQIAFQHYQQQFQALWADQMAEIEQTTQFKVHILPLARIKKIMKADEDVQMIAGEVPVVFAKACEMFILELTMRAWFHAEENKRRTLQKNGIAAAITRTDNFDFLVDVMPNEELEEDGMIEVRNQQPVTYMWPQLEQQQQPPPPPPPPQGCDGSQDEQV